jgi:adenine phosphoribosyltransferase
MDDSSFREHIRVFRESETGWTFFDTTPLMADGRLFREAIRALGEPLAASRIDVVLGIEARGFYFAPALAARFGAGFVPARRPGKLKGKTRRARAAPADQVGVVRTPGEAGQSVGGMTTYPKPSEFEILDDGIKPGDRVVIVDDLLVKGASALACSRLVEECEGLVVSCVFLIELVGFGGSQLLAPRPVHSVLKYTEV